MQERAAMSAYRDTRRRYGGVGSQPRGGGPSCAATVNEPPCQRAKLRRNC